jgi:hypothetical protein
LLSKQVEAALRGHERLEIGFDGGIADGEAPGDHAALIVDLPDLAVLVSQREEPALGVRVRPEISE